MAPASSLRELVATALERLDNHIADDNRRFGDERGWREDFSAAQEQKHRDNLAALARSEDAARTHRAGVYTKLDDLAGVIGNVERAAGKSANKTLWAIICGLGALLLSLAAATAYLADHQYRKDPPKQEQRQP